MTQCERCVCGYTPMREQAETNGHLNSRRPTSLELNLTAILVPFIMLISALGSSNPAARRYVTGFEITDSLRGVLARLLLPLAIWLRFSPSE